MAEKLGTIYVEIDARTTGYLTQSKQVDQQALKTEKNLADVEKQMDRTNDASRALGGGLSTLATALKAVLAANALREIAGMVQGYQEMADRVRLATSSTEEFNMVQQRLLNTANGTYRSLSEAQELYIRTADSLRSMGYSTQQALDVTDAMSYSFVTNATNAEKAASATDAFSKVLAKGKVEADAWETILAATPSVIQAVADASGKSAAEVRSLGAAGKLSASDLTEGLRRSLDETAKAAAGMSNNLTDAATRTRTALTAVFVALENQTGAWQKLTDGIIMAADWILQVAGDSDKMTAILDSVTAAGTALAAVIAGRLVTSFATFTAAQYTSITAANQQIIAAQAAAKANLDLAAAELAAAKAALDQQKAIAAAGGSMRGAAADANTLAVAEQRVKTAQEGMNAAMTAAQGVATRTAYAMGLLRTAMGFLGGPVGVVLLAASALYSFATASGEAKDKVDALNGSLEKLSASQLGRAANEVKSEIADLEDEAKSAKAEVDGIWKGQLESQERFNRRQTELQAALDDVNDKLKARRDRLAEIATAQNRLANPPKAPEPTVTNPTANQRDPDAQARIDALKEEQALLQKTGVERAKLKALQQLGDKATPEQRKEAEALAASIYALEQAEKSRNEAKKKGESDAAKATRQAEAERKKAASEEKKGIEENQKAFAELGIQIGSVGKTARELAQDQAQLSLNEYATPEQIQQIRTLAGALYDLQGSKQLLSQNDPIAAENINYQQQLTELQTLNDQKLLSDQRYLELKGQAERAHLEEMRALQEANFRAASLGNELLLSSIDSLAQSGTQALSGLLSGTSNLKDAMGSIAQTILGTVIGAFVQMAANWVKQQIVMAATSQATAAGATAFGIAQAGTLGAAWAGPAALASLATLGGNAVPAAAAITSTTAIAATAGLTGGLRNGGLTVPGGMYRVNEGGAPEIFTGGNGQQYLLPNKRGQVVSNADATGGGAAAPIVNINNYGSGTQASGSAKFNEADRRWVVDVIVQDMQANGATGRTANQITGTRRQGQ